MLLNHARSQLLIYFRRRYHFISTLPQFRACSSI